MARTSVACVVALVAALGCTADYVRPPIHADLRTTPERLARGAYLVNSAMACGVCHTPRADRSPLAAERADRLLAGRAVAWPGPGARLWIPNLTPDVETGLGAWSDDEIMRAIRDGVARDGRLLAPLMPFQSYRFVCDEDVRSIVAYLRSLPPVRNARRFADNDVGLATALLVGGGALHHEPARDVSAPNRADPVANGAYVMRLGHCWECHSATRRGPRDVGAAGFMSGDDRADAVAGVGVVYARNLTPARRTGLGRTSAEELARALRTGTRLDGRALAPPMSDYARHFAGLDARDLDALVTFLRSLPPDERDIPERALEPAFAKRLSSP
jgi:mono/diheme cytochrome c family protein